MAPLRPYGSRLVVTRLDDGLEVRYGLGMQAMMAWAGYWNLLVLVGAVVWLASSRASSFVTGQNIGIDGGFSSVTI